jgi:hypothetical protein
MSSLSKEELLEIIEQNQANIEDLEEEVRRLRDDLSLHKFRTRR